MSDGEGSVYFMCTWYGLSSSVSDKLTAEARHSLSYNKPVPAAVLSVYVDSAKDLVGRPNCTESGVRHGSLMILFVVYGWLDSKL